MKICAKCKNSIPDDSIFCEVCGSKCEENDSNAKEDAAKLLVAMALQNTVSSQTFNKENHVKDEYKRYEYGYAPEYPIFTTGPRDSIEYLSKLKNFEDETYKWERVGSVVVPSVGGNVDIYEGYDAKRVKKVTLYVNMYGEKTSDHAPRGFYLSQYKSSRNGKRNTKGIAIFLFVLFAVVLLICLFMSYFM